MKILKNLNKFKKLIFKIFKLYLNHSTTGLRYFLSSSSIVGSFIGSKRFKVLIGSTNSANASRLGIKSLTRFFKIFRLIDLHPNYDF